MGVNLRGGEIFMPQELLDRVEIPVTLREVSGEEMTESVRRDHSGDPGICPGGPDGVPGVREGLDRSS